MKFVFFVLLSFFVLLIFSSCHVSSIVSRLEEEKELYEKMKPFL